MLLPGRLRDTTLGDLLGTLHRARATGRLSLIDDQGQSHDVVLRDGLIHEVITRLGPRLGDVLDQDDRWAPEAAHAELRLGEYLLRQGKVSGDELREALGKLNLLKLDRLFQLSDAMVRFHVVRPPRADEAGPRILDTTEFLGGRPRKHAREAVQRRHPSRGEALEVLGLPAGASRDDIRQAFRALAQRCHPDRHPDASAVEKTRLIVQFSRLTHAYHALLG